MIGDIIDSELENNQEYMHLKSKIEKNTNEIQKLSKEYESILKRNKKLEIFGNISQLLTFILCLINLACIPFNLIILVANTYGKKLNRELEKNYQDEIIKISDQSLYDIEKSKDILYKTYDEVEKKLQNVKEEVKWHLKNKNYDEIIKNYKVFENVLPLIENEGYYAILLYLIENAKNGLKHIHDISETDKFILEMTELKAAEIEKTKNNKNQKSLGEKQRELDEALEQAAMEKVGEFLKEEIEKRYTKTKK